jgi:hypothetical protein
MDLKIVNTTTTPKPDTSERRARLIRFIQHHFLTLAFVGGFVTDFLLLNRVDDKFDNGILTLYVVLATLSLLVFYAALARRLGEVWSYRFEKYASMLMQYSYGGLFSGMLIFYGKSGAILASWPFLLLIISAILGNELIKQRGQKLVFNLYAYFVGLYSFVVLQIPTQTGWMSAWTFFWSGIISLVIVYGVVQLLALIIPRYIEIEMKKLVFVIFSTFAVFNVLYITNIIPPIPLSLKEITIAQSVVRVGNQYEVLYEPTPWWQVWKRVHGTFHPSSTGTVACFSSVFAPTKITTKVFHTWDYKDQNGVWQEHFRLPYPIIGGGANGYRGYSAIQSFHDGVWRCSVETERGQIIGRQVFTIDSSVAPKILEKQLE